MFFEKISPIQKSWYFHYTDLDCFPGFLFINNMTSILGSHFIGTIASWYYLLRCQLPSQKKMGFHEFTYYASLFSPFRTTTFSGQICESPNFPPRVAQRKRSVKQMMYNTPGQPSIVVWLVENESHTVDSWVKAVERWFQQFTQVGFLDGIRYIL